MKDEKMIKRIKELMENSDMLLNEKQLIDVYWKVFKSFGHHDTENKHVFYTNITDDTILDWINEIYYK